MVDWVASRDEKLHKRLVRLTLIAPRRKQEIPTLGDWVDRFLESHGGKPSTMAALTKAKDNLFDHFARKRMIDSITPRDARSFETNLTKNGNRHDKDRAGLAPNTVRRRIGMCKQFLMPRLRPV